MWASATLAAITHQLGQLQARIVQQPLANAPMPNQSYVPSNQPMPKQADVMTNPPNTNQPNVTTSPPMQNQPSTVINVSSG